MHFVFQLNILKTHSLMEGHCSPAMQEIQVQSRGQEDPLEKEVTTHSSILAWEIPWTGQSMGL